MCLYIDQFAQKRAIRLIRANPSLVCVCVFFTLTDRASTIPSNIRGCQSGTWSQRGTKVNGSHHGDNPLLGPTGIQIATKSYATLQAMAPTNNKTVHQTSFTPYREYHNDGGIKLRKRLLDDTAEIHYLQVPR